MRMRVYTYEIRAVEFAKNSNPLYADNKKYPKIHCKFKNT